MEKLQFSNILNILIVAFGVVYFYCVNNKLVEAKTKMKLQDSVRFKRKTNYEVIEPPPITSDNRVNRRSMGFDYHNITKQDRSRHKGKYTEVTDVAREGRKSEDLDLVPFTVASTELLLNIDIAACVFAHNQIRRKHNISELLWDTELSYGAEEWALVLAARGLGTSKLFICLSIFYIYSIKVTSVFY